MGSGDGRYPIASINRRLARSNGLTCFVLLTLLQRWYRSGVTALISHPFLGFGAGAALGGDQLGAAVDVVEREVKATVLCKLNQQPRAIRREVLPSFVVANVSLGAVDPIGKDLLRHAKVFADGFEVMHASLSVRLMFMSTVRLFCFHEPH